ncbi:28S ribosomal protein S30, mitochondrial [Elysia marginata]|uniref:28S ribosomal protein S30, mitochondrial n=1 Tax=Elysia marginata TaxID=1093978 RepID=A0AAV4JQ35_9GAST|nr:28S ribosomal protein S30, mitochondrial [Elysia marginata]
MASPFTMFRPYFQFRSKLAFDSCLRSSVRVQHSLRSKSSSALSQDVEGLSESSDLYKIDVKYPPIKPKYPPGKWGQMDHKYAWRWNEARENQLSIPDVQGRINALTEKEMQVIQLEPINDHPASLLFRQYATKTVMRPWEEVPLYNDEITEEDFSQTVSQLGKDISDFLLMEHEVLQRHSSDGETIQTHLCQYLIRLISNSLITRLGNHFPHLKTCQYDENVLVRSLWDRHGIERKRRRYTSDSDVLLFDPVQDQRIVSEGYFQAMLRSHQPLPPVRMN